MPAYSVQQLGNVLDWGLVDDAPNSFVWEIGHTGDYTTPAGQYCVPGSATKPPCFSYTRPNLAPFSPVVVEKRQLWRWQQSAKLGAGSE